MGRFSYVLDISSILLWSSLCHSELGNTGNCIPAAFVLLCAKVVQRAYPMVIFLFHLPHRYHLLDNPNFDRRVHVVKLANRSCGRVMMLFINFL